MSLGQVELSTICQGIVKEENVRAKFANAHIGKLVFKKVECKRGIYLYPVKIHQDNELVNFLPQGEWIIFRGHGEEYSQGFGGAVMKFAVEDDEGNISDLSLQGPWHGNSSSLFKDTGVNLLDKHYTWFVVLNEQGGVVYKDKEPILDLFERPALSAKALASIHGTRLFLHSQTSGGSSTGWVEA